MEEFWTDTYARQNVVSFRKTNEPYGGLSNMAGGFPLYVNNIRIRTAEALYQACRFPNDPDVQRIIIEQHSPMTAKMKSKPHRRTLTREDWLGVRVDVMRWCLRVKMICNPKAFSSLLSETGSRHIVEESARDNFWGARATGEGSLKGMNVLGKLLMELRDEVVRSDVPTIVSPPDIPNFLLLGNPIGPINKDQVEHSASEDEGYGGQGSLFEQGEPS